MVKINVGFIGCGFVAQQCHLPAVESIESFEISSLADPHPNLRERLGFKYSTKNTFSCHKEMLADANLDCVVVTLPRKLSFKIIKDCLYSKKHIFTEKPLCLSSANGQTLLDLATANNLLIMPGYMRRHDAAVSLFNKRLREIEKSSIISISAYCHMGDSYCAPFGDFKSINIDPISYSEEQLPAWLPEERHVQYEQFLNVFSHITDLVEHIFNGTLSIEHACTNDWGEGIILCTIKGIPISFNLLRGNQAQWREGLSIATKERLIELSLAPAFLRNQTGFIREESGRNNRSITHTAPSYSWAFRNQMLFFRDLLVNSDYSIHYADSAVRQIRFAEDLFVKYIA